MKQFHISASLAAGDAERTTFRLITPSSLFNWRTVAAEEPLRPAGLEAEQKIEG